MQESDATSNEGESVTAARPTTLKQLRGSCWQPKTVKHELRDNFLAALKANETLFPGIVGYEDTVILSLIHI